CCAYGCTMRSGVNLLSEVKFYRFPKDVNRRRAWTNAIGRQNFEPTYATRICSKHFITGAPSASPSHPDWVPNVAMPGGVGCTAPANQKALERYDRVSARTRKVPAAEPSPPIPSPAVAEPEVGSNEAKFAT
ncbi:hypothetical protein HPB47_013055, partial [Ixodes persulcatus]